MLESRYDATSVLWKQFFSSAACVVEKNCDLIPTNVKNTY